VRGEQSWLKLGFVAKEIDNEIIEGSLICSHPACQREHPIFDGIPVVLADASSWIANQFSAVIRREDLSDFAESLIGDLAGQGSGFDHERGNNSIYAHAHWGQEGGYPHLFEAAMQLLAERPSGLWLDIGCSVGRGTFELARRTGELAVGLDLNFSMLRLAERIRRTRRVRYSRRRVGLVFDPVDNPLAEEFLTENVSFWCADVSILPFPDAAFAGAISMNMLDCVASPLGLLLELSRTIAKGSAALVCTPFDWAVGATALASWIGGHSQRSTPEQGSSLAELRRYLSATCEAGIDTGLSIEAEQDNVPWRLSTNERAVTEYSVYMAKLRRKL